MASFQRNVTLLHRREATIRQPQVFVDANVSRFYRKQRRRQLDVMVELRASIGAPPRSREEDAIHLFTTERTFDAIARGELRDLGLDRKIVIEAMIQKVISVLS